MTRVFLALLTVAGVAVADSKAPQFVKNLGGCFAVSYRFVEDGKKDYTLPNEKMKEVYEWITVKDNSEGAHVVQHYGVYRDDETGKFGTMTHFFEEWSSPKAGVWVQKVFNPGASGPDRKPRYVCESAERFGQISCKATPAPKPQRDKPRKDYDYLNRVTMLQISPIGWVQSEMNDKVKKDVVNEKGEKADKVIATELGWIEYRKLLKDDSVCTDAKKEFPQG